MNFSMSAPRNEPFLAFAVLLIALITSSLVLQIMGFWFNVSLARYVLPVAFLPCLALTYGYFFRPSVCNLAAGLLLTNILAVLGIGLRYVLDFSMDGMAVHQPLIEAILNGFIPIYNEDHILQLYEYPPGAWAVRASVAALYDSIDAGKTLNIWWVFIAIPTLLAGLRNIFGKLQLYHHAMVCLLILNPIVIVQFVTGYADGSVYLGGMTFIGALLMFGDCPRRNQLSVFLMSVCVLILINTKIVGLYDAVMLCAGAVIYLYLLQRKIPWKVTGILFVVGITATIIFGYRPYVTNILEFGSVVTGGYGGLAEGAAPTSLIPLPVVLRFFYSIFSVYSSHDAILKWPWIIYKTEMEYSGQGVLYAGFGPLFALGLVLSVTWFVLHLVYIRWKKNNWTIHKGLISIAFILLIFSICCPQNWWARYVPFAYAVPFLLLLALYPQETRPHSSLYVYILLCVFAANSYILANSSYAGQTWLQNNFYRVTADLRKVPPHSVYLIPVFAGANYKTLTKADITIQHRLREQGIDSVVKVNVPCDHKAWRIAEFDICY